MDFKNIDKLSAELKNMRPLNDTEIKRLRDEFIIENTYNSNAIEGNTLTLRETALILQEGITIAEKPIKEHLEAIGYRDAFDYIISLAEHSSPLSEKVIKDIHSLVLMNDAQNKGVYRSVPVTILGALHKPPQPYLVAEEMGKLIEEYNELRQTVHIIEAVAMLHLEFESIHPFIDGNGRTGRLILNLELIKAGLLPINIKFADRRKYYDCFDSYAETHNTGNMLQLIAQYETEELERYISFLKG